MYPLRDAKVVNQFNQTHQINAAISITKGLNYLNHDCPTSIVYGDLKPYNILFNTFIEVKIINSSVIKTLNNNGIGPST